MTDKVSKVEPLKAGGEIPGAKNAVFVCIYTRDCQPFDVDNPEIPAAIRLLKTNKLALFARHDSTIGFPGGSCEKEDFEQGVSFLDGLKRTAQREVRQETGFTADADKLELLCSHLVNGKTATHLFGCEVDYETLMRIDSQASAARQFHSESTGIILPTTMAWPGKDGDFDFGKGIFACFQYPAPVSFREELFEALDRLRLADISILKEIERRFLPPAYAQKRAVAAVPPSPP